MIAGGAFILAYWYRPLSKNTADKMFVEDAASVQDTTVFVSQSGAGGLTLNHEDSLEEASVSVEEPCRP